MSLRVWRDGSGTISGVGLAGPGVLALLVVGVSLIQQESGRMFEEFLLIPQHLRSGAWWKRAASWETPSQSRRVNLKSDNFR